MASDAWIKPYFGSIYPQIYALDHLTKGQVDGVERMLGLTPERRILDVCCGYGRHTLELARRGYRHVVGVDLSRPLLAQARRTARAEGLRVDFRLADMRRLPFRGSFDVGLNLFTSFGYFQDDWRVNRNLTLNLGIRWDANINMLPDQTNNRTIQILQKLNDPRAQAITGDASNLSRRTPGWAEFQPRLGFAYDVKGDGRTVIRGGYGIFYDQIFQNLSREEAIAEARRIAEARAAQAGADPATLEVVDVEDLPLAYLPGNSLRTRVRVVGEIARIAAG